MKFMWIDSSTFSASLNHTHHEKIIYITVFILVYTWCVFNVQCTSFPCENTRRNSYNISQIEMRTFDPARRSPIHPCVNRCYFQHYSSFILFVRDTQYLIVYLEYSFHETVVITVHCSDGLVIGQAEQLT